MNRRSFNKSLLTGAVTIPALLTAGCDEDDPRKLEKVVFALEGGFLLCFLPIRALAVIGAGLACLGHVLKYRLVFGDERSPLGPIAQELPAQAIDALRRGVPIYIVDEDRTDVSDKSVITPTSDYATNFAGATTYRLDYGTSRKLQIDVPRAEAKEFTTALHLLDVRHQIVSSGPQTTRIACPATQTQARLATERNAVALRDDLEKLGFSTSLRRV